MNSGGRSHPDGPRYSEAGPLQKLLWVPPKTRNGDQVGLCFFMKVKAAKIVERETPERAVSLYEKAADTVRKESF